MNSTQPSFAPEDPYSTIRVLQEELAQTNREVLGLTVELEKRVDERTAELRASEQEVQRANYELLELTAELERRVAERTRELQQANQSLRREIAERKEAELKLAQKAAALARSNADLEQYAYLASHQLQEPLRNIALCAGWFLQRYPGKLDAEADQLIQRLMEDAQRMSMMIRDLLAYTEISNPAGEVDIQVDANHVLRKALEDLQTVIRGANAIITADVLPVLRIREHGLRQIFHVLISNAIQYRSKAPACIHICSRACDDEWIFSVTDNGIGIDPQYHNRIFDIFKRLDRSDTYAGTGIGLAICKRILEQNNGRIWVESELNCGATFRFTLPRHNNLGQHVPHATERKTH